MASGRGGGSRGVNVLVAQLRRCKPTSLVCVSESGDESSVALTGQRGRYERAARSVLSLQAITVRCLDADGAVAEVLAVGGESAALDAEGGPRARDVPGEVARLVSIALEAQDRHRGRDLEMMSAVIDASVSVLRVAGERAERLEALLMKLTAKREKDLGELAADLATRMAALPSGDDEPGQADAMMGKVLELVSGSSFTTTKAAKAAAKEST